MTEDRPSLAEFQRALTDGELRTFQVVQGAIGGGVLFFGAIVIYLERTGARTEGDLSSSIVPMLSLVVLGFALLCIPAAVLFPRWMLARGPQESEGSPAGITPAGRWVATLRTARIVHLAILDGAAYLGIMVAFLGALSGVLRVSPVYWMNLLPGALLIVWVIVTFPTRERLEAEYRERVLSRARY